MASVHFRRRPIEPILLMTSSNLDSISQYLLAAFQSSKPLAELARHLSPSLIELHTHQLNSQPLIDAQSPQISEVVCQLYRSWQHQHPEAGEVYWLIQSWRMLIWQPITLTLIAVYARQTSLDLSQFKQRLNLESGIVSGYLDLQLSSPTAADDQQWVLNQSCRQLSQLLQDYRSALGQQGRLSEAVAMRLVKDQIANLMLKLAAAFPQLNSVALSHLLSPWSEQLQLGPKSPFFDFELNPERSTVLAKPSACCQHYRRADGDYCLNCPKLQRAELAQRLAAHKQSLQTC
ncbi:MULTISPECIES: siderophore ferric iron reductase [unclassified Agarivorans]|uniref:siderophore ferric iron reductase n=1 Tax=unclassified Agarivorans TaxID=2636026 RepID=UPI003D7EF192